MGTEKKPSFKSLVELAKKGDLEGNDETLFSTNHCRAKLAAERETRGLPVVKHTNGKIDLSVLLDENVKNEHICHYCKHSFAYRHVLQRHIQRIHEKHLLPTFRCPKCPYRTVWKDQMRSHFSVVHQNFKPFSCSRCGFRAPKSCRILTHIKRVHNGGGICLFDSKLKPETVSPTKKKIPQIRESKFEPTTNFELVKKIVPKQISNDTVVTSPERQKKPVEEEKEISTQFHCPYCDFTNSSQLLMGKHVISTHETKLIRANQR